MRTDRLAKPLPLRSHDLIRAVPGKNRHARGYYVCSCGETFGGLNAYEAHRADARKDGR